MRAILTYHSIDESGSPVSLSPAVFEAHAAFLGSGRVRVTDLAGVLAAGPDEDVVAITFDDAFTSFAERAWPALKARGLGATLFVVSDHAGGTNAWGGRDHPGIPTLPLLGWDALARLAEDGVRLGAHGRTHRALPSLDDAALADELEAGAAELGARTGRRPDALAYPYGAHDDRVVAAASGRYRHAVTTDHRPLGAREDAHRLPRLDAWYFGTRGLAAWGTPAFRAGVWARGRLRRLRAIVPMRERAGA